LRAAVWVLAGACVVSQAWQARQATGRLASDGRNPYAYVPTSRDIESLAPWLRELADASPETPIVPMAVIGDEYWPLPWYLRSFGAVGYWGEAPENIGLYPVVFAAGKGIDPMMERLAATHVPVPRGLRHEAPVIVFIRNDLWGK
jgi:predicted membrane-bound mannosyltransferase